MRSRLFLYVAIAVFAVLGSFDSPRIAAPLQDESTIRERVRRVENGLLPAVVINGQTAPMKIADRMAYYKTPGVSVVVINNGKIEWVKAYGVVEAGGSEPVSPATLFQAASISKPVAAMGALALVEQGKLSLDEDVNGRLKSWKVPDSDFTKEQKVTLRRLVTHSAGLTVHGFRGYAADEPTPTLAQALDGQKPANSAAIRVDILPSSRWRYSGGGYNVMQQLMIDVTGKQFPELMRELVLDKIGMNHSTYEQPLPKAMAAQAAIGHRASGAAVKGKWHTYPEMAAAGLWTTPFDLALFAIELQKSKVGKSNKVLSQAMTNQMLTKQIENWGLGISIGGDGKAASFSHGGANEGFRCNMFAYAETGQGAVVMTNSDAGGALASEIFRSIAREYGWPDFKPTERTLARVNPEIFKVYAGEYEVNGKVTVSVENGKLFLQPPGGPKMELYPSSETEFFAVTENIRIVFTKDEQGAVSGLTAHFGSRSLNGKKVK
jgi:CubicO group peptidase (beta-lactamase class C family)